MTQYVVNVDRGIDITQEPGEIEHFPHGTTLSIDRPTTEIEGMIEAGHLVNVQERNELEEKQAESLRSRLAEFSSNAGVVETNEVVAPNGEVVGTESVEVVEEKPSPRRRRSDR
jgi:hypothetical protein